METKFFQRPVGKLAYSDYGGSGQLVLMLPGMGDLRGEYRFLAPRLGDAGFRAVTVDLRGHGDSSVPWEAYDVPSVGGDILAIIEHLDAGAAHLVGTSFAAAAVVWAAAERLEAVRSLTLIGPFVRAARINPLMKALFWLMMNNPWRVRAWAAYYGNLYPSRKPPDYLEYVKQLAENLAQPGRFHAANALGTCSRQPSDERLEQVKAPALVIMGTKDPDFPDPAAEGKIVAERIHGALELVAGAGHYPHAELPELTAPIVIQFLTRVSGDGK